MHDPVTTFVIDVFSRPGALPPAGLEQVIAGVRGLDMDDVRAKMAADSGAVV